MAKVYARATPEQVNMKVSQSMRNGVFVVKLIRTRQVKALVAAVRRSVEIANTTTLWERIGSVLFVPVNRRALSKLSTVVFERTSHVIT